MGASLGLAATLPTTQALTIFGVLGLGMAAPYLLASAWPGLARALPRPGAWMSHFKTVMAFPMFATVIWLVWVVGHQTGVDGAAGLLGVLLALSFLAWALGSPQLGATARKGFAAAAIACLGLAMAWAVPGFSGTAEAAQTSSAAARGEPAWGAWSESRVQAALDAKQPVFVDFTAAWCVTCQFNKRTVLNQPEVLADLRAKNVLLLRADWTRKDAAITAELARMGRNGVPVYALHVPGESQPRLLGEILSVQQVQDALKGLP
jgi:thiol:disulfide interchange protein DsbD